MFITIVIYLSTLFIAQLRRTISTLVTRSGVREKPKGRLLLRLVKVQNANILITLPLKEMVRFLLCWKGMFRTSRLSDNNGPTERKRSKDCNKRNTTVVWT